MDSEGYEVHLGDGKYCSPLGLMDEGFCALVSLVSVRRYHFVDKIVLYRFLEILLIRKVPFSFSSARKKDIKW